MVKLHIPGLHSGPVPRDVFAPEVQALQNSLQECNIEVPSEYSSTTFLAGIAGAFTPTEIGPTDVLQVSATTQQIYRSIRHELSRRAGQSDQLVLDLGHQVGRTLAAGNQVGAVNEHPPFRVAEGAIFADGGQFNFSNQNGLIVEYGLGLNGLNAHKANLRAKKYRVAGFHRSKGEVAVLRGVAEFNGIEEEYLTLTSDGIAKSLMKHLKTHKDEADLLIASRVGGAGEDLRAGIKQSPEALRTDGLLIVRGPQGFRDGKGLGCDSALKVIQGNRRFEIMTNVDPTDYGNPQAEKRRLIIARKRF